MAEHIDRRQAKAETRALLKHAQVSPRLFFGLYLALTILLNLASSLAVGDTSDLLSKPLGLFALIFTNLITLILGIGCYLYGFAVRRGERAEILTLFDGFSFAGRIVLVYLAEYMIIVLWCIPASLAASLILVYAQSQLLYNLVLIPLLIPAVMAVYRYRFSVFNLCENPSLGTFQALDMSKKQTRGYKRQLLVLDLSFLGWILLAGLPAFCAYGSYFLSGAGVSVPVWNLAWPVQFALESVFALLFGICYLPVYQCTELAYFETAKRTSGVGAGSDVQALPPDSSDDIRWQ